jgi:hypothetical protein
MPLHAHAHAPDACAPAQVVCALSATQLALKQCNDVSTTSAVDECDALLSAYPQAR